MKMPACFEFLGHSYHVFALSKEVYNFVFAQGAQKLSAIIEMQDVFY